MKKIVIIFILLGITVNVFSIDWPDLSFSAGGGAILGYTFTRYTLKTDNSESKQNMDRFDAGGFVFYDFTYVEYSIIYQVGTYRYNEKMYYEEDAMISKGIGQEISFGFSLMGKYPFKINEKITWFPMLGIEFLNSLRHVRRPDGDDKVYDRSDGRLQEDLDKNLEPYPLSAWNSLWINIGAGVDYFLTKNIFLRGELIFGFRLPTDYEMGALALIKSSPEVDSVKMGGLTGNPKFKIAIGYRFDTKTREQTTISNEQGAISNEQLTVNNEGEIYLEEVIEMEEEVKREEQETEETEQIEEVVEEIDEIEENEEAEEDQETELEEQAEEIEEHETVNSEMLWIQR